MTGQDRTGHEGFKRARRDREVKKKNEDSSEKRHDDGKECRERR